MPAREASASRRRSSRCRRRSSSVTHEFDRERALNERLWPDDAPLDPGSPDDGPDGGALPDGRPEGAGPEGARSDLGHPPRFIVRTDGAARGNPGPASLGAVLIDAARPGALRPTAEPYATLSEYLGVRTNNVAEYLGVVRALEVAGELGAREVEMLLDSKLIVEQLHGRWRVKDAKLQPLWAEARRRLAGLDRWSARHVPRSENSAADALANEAIDRVQAGGPASVVWVAARIRERNLGGG